ncbi:Uncharacterised protein [uncultured archaeon]|nr:Uncharacterised protein [uncultured archaeon]
MEQCVQQCNPPQTCEENCQKYGNTAYYSDCLRQCKPTTTTTTTTTPPDCRDSDGSNINTAGEVHLGDQVYHDTCYDNMRVIEWTCKDGKPYQQRMTCPEECVNGACVQKPKTSLCEDSDGNNVNVYGVVRFEGKQYTDTCIDDLHVKEWICRDGKPTSLELTCAGRCVNGACSQSVTAMTYKG